MDRPAAGDTIDLSDPAFWAAPLSQRDDAFAALRGQEGLAFFAEPEVVGFPLGPGYYAVTRHADVIEASRQPDLFCSGRGTNIPDMPPDFLEFFGSMINMDDPRHARLRRIVSRAFTPKMLTGVIDQVQGAAASVVDGIIDKGECDFVTEVAARLPLRIICDLMGIPPEEEQFIFDRSNVILGAGDPEYVDDPSNPGLVLTALLTAGQELAALVTDLGERRMREPQHDLTTALVTAEVDGDHLSSAELASFFILLVVAGNETTRNAIAHAMVALTDHPEQRHAWIADFDAMAPAAVEEIVRWATPVIHFRRTVTRDGVRLGGQDLREGDKVVLFYNSANRDAAVFDDPDRFDLRRSPNDHVGFGGPGPHFCLGAHLARREVTVMFRELFDRVPDIHACGPPDRLQSNFINGIKHLPVEFTAGGRAV